MLNKILILTLLTACGNDTIYEYIPNPAPPVLDVDTLLTETLYHDNIDICNGSGTIETSGFDDNNDLKLNVTEINTMNTICTVPEENENEDTHEYVYDHYRCFKFKRFHHCWKRR